MKRRKTKAGVEVSPSRAKPGRRGRQTRQRARTKLDLRRILVPIDFSAISRRALDVAVPLAGLLKGRITLVHVVPLEMYPLEAAPAVVDDMGRRENAEAALETLAAEKVPSSLLEGVVVRRGSPYHEVVRQARAMKADLIVLTTHGHTALKRVFLGSTAERVVRHAPCPVLTLRDR